MAKLLRIGPGFSNDQLRIAHLIRILARSLDHCQPKGGTANLKVVFWLDHPPNVSLRKAPNCQPTWGPPMDTPMISESPWEQPSRDLCSPFSSHWYNPVQLGDCYVSICFYDFVASQTVFDRLLLTLGTSFHHVLRNLRHGA